MSPVITLGSRRRYRVRRALAFAEAHFVLAQVHIDRAREILAGAR